MKLEHGKRYVTRSGMITPPLNERHGGISFDIHGANGGVMLWGPDGKFQYRVLMVYMTKILEADRPKLHTEDLDLVAEYNGPDDEDDATDLEPEPFYVTEMMIKYGGGFVQALGKAYRQADDVNSAIIRKSFRKYWQQYADMYRKKEKQSYRGWWIEYTSPGEWRYVHQDYDGTVDGYDRRIGMATSFLDAVDAVNEYILENTEVSIED